MLHVRSQNQRLLNSLLLLAGLAMTTTHASGVNAQSNTRMRRGTVNQVPHGSTSRMPATMAALGLNGYCPVCIIEMKKWVKGSPQVAATYDGKTYYFPGADQRNMFLADPAKYVPALGGDCTVCYAKMGKRMPGSIQHAALSKKRLYLFPARDQQQEFIANAPKYVDVDLANGGNCIVCRVEMGKDMPGKPEIAAYHNGWRYLFPGKDQRDMFVANPTKYVPAAPTNSQSSASRSGEHFVSITGKSGCAGCDHGVKPIGAPNELGLAVNASDGQVYVVENAHQLYPKLYEDRFNGVQLAVSGKVIKREGKVTWLEPREVKLLN